MPKGIKKYDKNQFSELLKQEKSGLLSHSFLVFLQYYSATIDVESALFIFL